MQNFPNPFNPATTIKYTIEADMRNEIQDVKLEVYDLTGRNVIELVNEKQMPGNYEIEFSSQSGSVQNLTSGVYFYSIRVNNFFETKKMILLK